MIWRLRGFTEECAMCDAMSSVCHRIFFTVTPVVARERPPQQTLVSNQSIAFHLGRLTTNPSSIMRDYIQATVGRRHFAAANCGVPG
jgi:hypothetical protein